ncbi:hypothetical protein D3C73_1027050 [compost metagenome]
MTVSAVNAHFAVTQLVFGQANRGFTLGALQTPVEYKRLLLVANDAANLHTAKRPTVTERINSFQHAGFTAAVSAD